MYKYKLVHFNLENPYSIESSCSINDLFLGNDDVEANYHIISSARKGIGTKLKRYSDKK